MKAAAELSFPLSTEAAIYVGDSPNDVSCFERFTHSVGVANVVEHLERLRVQPAFVTDADRGQGFAELAEYIIESKTP